MVRFVFFPKDGLGNLLFQHAFIYALAKRHATRVNFFVDYADWRPNVSVYARLFKHAEFLDTAAINALCAGKNISQYEEPATCYIPYAPPASADVTLLKGYFQSRRYFEEFENEISELLKSNESDLFQEMKKEHSRISNGNSTTCVHLRRGDFIKLQDRHRVLDEEYYLKGLEHLPQNRLLIFCEEIDESADWAVWKGRDVVFVTEKDPLRAMFLMACCDHFLIANSTFSTWGYYLRENRQGIIVAPRVWRGPNGPNYEAIDFVPETAILI